MKRNSGVEGELEEPYKLSGEVNLTNVHKVLAKDLLKVKAQRNLVTLQDTVLLYDAIEKMAYEKVLSLPVLKGNKFVGFLDVVDIVKFSISHFNKDFTNINEVLQHFDKKSEKFSSTPVSSILKAPKPKETISEETTFIEILDTLKSGIHRVLVFPHGDVGLAPVGIITQSDIVKVLYHNEIIFERQTALRLKKTNIPKPVTVTVPVTSTVYSAFNTLIENNYSAVPVTSLDKSDPEAPGRLLLNLSASDIRGLGVVCSFQSLAYPVDKFFLAFRKTLPPPVTVTLNNLVQLVIAKMVLFGIHRVWICDNEHEHVTHLVSMTDIIDYISHVIKNQ
eukprot:TRINITY_DN1552_c0_g1_i1.p1 TRINITY_DN1552_c0_g1~~TRINITY_DN1552_c0_g1_i1.p1  ORF type:complete len:335 (+),score=57.44 TRINITY_DN1552_c0_g1_i1:51-1055(+)